MKTSISSFFILGLLFFSIQTQAQSNCSATLDTNTEATLSEFVTELNPFWGTWRGTHKGESIVAEMYLDKQNKFNIRGTYGKKSLQDQKIRLCYENNKFRAVIMGFSVEVTVKSPREIQAHHMLLGGSVTMRR